MIDYGYDPNDPNSFPYGFTRANLMLDPATLEVAPDLNVIDMLVLISTDPDQVAAFRMIDMALRLLNELQFDGDGAFSDISTPDLLAACIHTAMIWERG